MATEQYCKNLIKSNYSIKDSLKKNSQIGFMQRQKFKKIKVGQLSSKSAQDTLHFLNQ